MKKFNIALTFNKEVAQSIVDYSKRINDGMQSDVILGENSNPHMTIGQFSIDETKVSEIWQKFNSIVDETPKITLAGITILPSSSGGAWIEISVLKSQALLKLQEKLIKILEPYTSLSNDIGDKFRPHITVSHLLSGNIIKDFSFNYNPLRLKNIETNLGIGIGTNFLEPK